MPPADDPPAEAGPNEFDMTTLSPVPLLSAEPQPRLPPPPKGPSAGRSAPMPPNMYQQSFDGPMPSSTPFPDYMGYPRESDFDIMRKKMSRKGLDRRLKIVSSKPRRPAA
ncbi:unnamed protein product [Cylicostephanus goldi]|uniref:Uncharacterized protein n=1 Tax=Cylicostephanus goldi TaxID=71465 RepID=A0A3P7P4V7_CYLGO|nr:unnamed protein product [Cylicostephanus goldi]